MENTADRHRKDTGKMILYLKATCTFHKVKKER